jgi:putative flippase GtrA
VVSNNKVRYLLIGGINTLFGYLVGVFTYKLFNSILGIIGVGLLANVLAISFSFVTYKLFVFKTKGFWVNEYLKSYLVYGLSALLASLLLWLFVDVVSLSIWLAQAMVIIGMTIISYIGHSKITFNRKSKPNIANEK